MADTSKVCRDLQTRRPWASPRHAARLSDDETRSTDMPRPATPTSIRLAEPALPHPCATAAMTMRPRTRPIADVVMDALAQPTEALRTARSLLEPLGAPRGWSWG